MTECAAGLTMSSSVRFKANLLSFARLLVVLIYVLGFGALIAFGYFLSGWMKASQTEYGSWTPVLAGIVIALLLVGLGYLIDRRGPKARR